MAGKVYLYLSIENDYNVLELDLTKADSQAKNIISAQAGYGANNGTHLLVCVSSHGLIKNFLVGLPVAFAAY